MADQLSYSFSKVCDKFKLSDLNEHQKEAINQVVIRKRDTFVGLPTGFGKSVIFQALPLVFDDHTDTPGHIVIVVSPLLSLIQDQIERLNQLGVSCVSLSNVKTDEEIALVESGSYSVVYATPESLLKNERWRRMLSSDIYQKKVCAIAVDEAHVIKQWGTSNSTKMAPFRECYGRLHELRSLIPSAVILTLTATATKETKRAVMDVLDMNKPYVIEESPEKPNVAYVFHYMDRYRNIQDQFEWLAEEVKNNGLSAERTIIYCQTIQQCSHIYSTMKAIIGDTIYVETVGDQRKVLLEMLHSCSPPSNKEAILKSFQDPKGVIRILVATIAFGMGVDCKEVHRTIHFGPSKNLEAFIQESGRAGRDGKPSTSYLLYHGLLLTHVEKDIKNLINTKDCRRKCLLQAFGASANDNVVGHLCCDNCSKNCKCGSGDCSLLKYPSKTVVQQSIFSRERVVSESQKEQLKEKLNRYHKTLVAELVSKHANGIIKSQSLLPMLIGFSETQITQVMDHCTHLFSLQDVNNFVEIWEIKHAFTILDLMDQVFNDVSHISTTDKSTESYEDADVEDEIDLALNEWNDVINDSDFIDLIFDNIDGSLCSEIQEESGVSTHLSGIEIPNTVLAVLENFSFQDA